MNRGEKHHRTRLTANDIVIIRRLCRAGASLSRIAREYDYTPSDVFDIVRGNTWRHVSERAQGANRIKATIVTDCSIPLKMG